MEIRAWMQNKKEVIEITSSGCAGIRYEQDAGLALADFLYEDFSRLRQELEETQPLLKKLRQGEDVDAIRGQMLDLGRRMTNQHIYLAPLERLILQMLRADSSKIDVKYLSHRALELEREQADVKALLEECLDADAPDSMDALEKYALAVRQGHFEGAHPLRCGSIAVEMVVGAAGGVQFLDVLNPDSMFDLIDFAKIHLLRSGILLRRCKSCGRYFALSGNSNAEYCGRRMEGSTKTCREIGPVKVYQRKKFSDPVEKVFNRAYKTRNARIRAGKLTKEQFSDWAVEARRMRDLCLKGEIELDDFEVWLKLSE